MKYLDKYKAWLDDKNFDEEFKKELREIPKEELEDRFYKDLEFGTAGLRGINGAGSNRMNKYIISKVSQAYADFLIKEDKNASCIIAYDNRRYSKTFAKLAASTLAANGVRVEIFSELRATPELSFSIRYKNFTGGIVMTASHNPPEYSGYKVYGSDGAQLSEEGTRKIAELMEKQDGFSNIKNKDFNEAIEENLIKWVDKEYDDAYLEAIKVQQIHKEAKNVKFPFIYTALNGAGAYIMRRLFSELGHKDANYVEEQMIADPEFTTCKEPNPESEKAFEYAIKMADEKSIDFLLASDPDADRLGAMCRKKDGNFQKIDGNQLGILFANYLIEEKKNMPDKPVIVRSLVTANYVDRICKANSIDLEVAHTGFKNICGLIRKFEADKSKNFIYGFEESYGYLIGDHCRDKDSIVSAMMLVEMAKYYKSKSKTLFMVLDEIYQKYGYTKDKLISLTKPGKSGMEEIQEIMRNFEKDFAKEQDYSKLTRFENFREEKVYIYQDGEEVNIEKTSLAKANTLKFYFDDSSWFAIRPSGTEPKIKFYFAVFASDKDSLDEKMEKFTNYIVKFAGF